MTKKVTKKTIGKIFACSAPFFQVERMKFEKKKKKEEKEKEAV